MVYYQLDHLGTPIAAHNAKGEAVWTAEYEAWGRIRNETVSDGLKVNIPFRFQGQYYDEESGLHYNRFRYYDPEIGRFVSQDPIGLRGGMNLFEYAPNPVGWTDPLGLLSEWRRNWEARYGALPAGYQVHHIIPKEEMVLSSLRKLCPSYDIHQVDNLIALPESSSISQQNKPGFGKTIHSGYHKGYSLAVKKMLEGAVKFKKQGLSSCAKIKAIQRALKQSLVKGDISMYKSNSKLDTSYVTANWSASVKNNLRSGN